MKRLITREDVCDVLGIPATSDVEPKIDQAEAMVAAYIQGTLHETIKTERQSFTYDQVDSIELHFGPAVELLDMLVSGAEVTLDFNGENETSSWACGRWSMRQVSAHQILSTLPRSWDSLARQRQRT